MKPIMKNDVNALKLYLRAKGVPPRMIEDIRSAFINEALAEATAMQYDRIFCALALALRRTFGFGCVRTVRFMREFDKICCLASEPDHSWDEFFKDLDDELGIILRTDRADGQERLVLEYVGDSARRAKQIIDAEEAEKDESHKQENKA